MGTVADKVAQSLIGVAGVYQQDMGTLLIILAHQVVGEERLSAARRSEYELVAVGCYAPFHRLVGDVEVYRSPREPVNHLYAEWRQRGTVVCLGGEETGRRLDKRVETFLGGKIRLVAGHRSPEQCRAVDCVVPRHTSHRGELSADIVLDAAQLLGVVAPCHYVEMRPDRRESVTVRLVEIEVYPLLVDSI